MRALLDRLGVLGTLPPTISNTLSAAGFIDEADLALLTKEDAEEYGISRCVYRRLQRSLAPPPKPMPNTPGTPSSHSVRSPGELSLSSSPAISRTSSTSSAASATSLHSPYTPTQMSRSSSTASFDSTAGRLSPLRDADIEVGGSPSESEAQTEAELTEMRKILSEALLAWNKLHGVEEAATVAFEYRKGKRIAFVVCLICDAKTQWHPKLKAWYHFNRHIKLSKSHGCAYKFEDRPRYQLEQEPGQRLTRALAGSTALHHYEVFLTKDGTKAFLVHKVCRRKLEPTGSDDTKILRAEQHHAKCIKGGRNSTTSAKKRRRIHSALDAQQASPHNIFGTSQNLSPSATSRLGPHGDGLGAEQMLGSNNGYRTSTPTEMEKRPTTTRETRRDTAFAYSDTVSKNWVGDLGRAFAVVTTPSGETEKASADDRDVVVVNPRQANSATAISGRTPNIKGARIARMRKERAADNKRTANTGRLDTSPAPDSIELGGRAADSDTPTAPVDNDVTMGSADEADDEQVFDAYEEKTGSALPAQPPHTRTHGDDDHKEKRQGAIDVVLASPTDDPAHHADGSNLTSQSNVGRYVLYLAVPYDSTGAVAGKVFVVVGKIRSIEQEDGRWWYDTVDYTATHDQHYPKTILDSDWYSKKTDKGNWLDLRESFVIGLFDHPDHAVVKVPRAQARQALDVLRDHLHQDVIEFMSREGVLRPTKAVKAARAAVPPPPVADAADAAFNDAEDDPASSSGSDPGHSMYSAGVRGSATEEDSQHADDSDVGPVLMDATVDSGSPTASRTSISTAPAGTNRRLVLGPDLLPHHAADGMSKAQLMGANGGVRTESGASTTTGTPTASTGGAQRPTHTMPSGFSQRKQRVHPSTKTTAVTSTSTTPMNRAQVMWTHGESMRESRAFKTTGIVRQPAHVGRPHPRHAQMFPSTKTTAVTSASSTRPPQQQAASGVAATPFVRHPRADNTTNTRSSWPMFGGVSNGTTGTPSTTSSGAPLNVQSRTLGMRGKIQRAQQVGASTMTTAVTSTTSSSAANPQLSMAAAAVQRALELTNTPQTTTSDEEAQEN